MTEDATRAAEREARRAEREAREAGGGSRKDGRASAVTWSSSRGRSPATSRPCVQRHPPARAEAREVVAVLGSINLEAGSSARQVVAIGGDVHVGPGASVEKDAVSIAGACWSIRPVTWAPEGAHRDPRRRRDPQEAQPGGHEESSSAGWSLAKWVAKFGVMLLLGFC